MKSEQAAITRAPLSVWLVAFLYVALTVVLTYPLPLQMAAAVLNDNPDTHLFMWTLGWDVHAFTAQPLSIFDANIYYPQRLTLAYSENLIGSAFFAAPVLWLTNNPVLALNVVTLLSCALCGVGAYLLARRIGLSTASAILCGLIFAFSPARFFRITQLHLSTVQWVPFTLAYLHSYMDGGRPKDLRIAVAFFSLQALTSGHGAVFATVAVLGLLVFRFATGDPLAFIRRVRDFGLPGLVLILPTILVFLPYLVVERELGLQRSLENFDPIPVSFLASPTSLHSFLLSLLPGTPINEQANGFLFPGYVALILAAVAVFPARRPATNSVEQPSEDQRRGASQRAIPWRALGFYTLLTIVCLWLSAGTPLKLWSWVNGLPGLSLVRVPSRFMILAVLGLAVMAAFGFERIGTKLSAPRRALLAFGLDTLLVIESSGAPLQLAPFRVDPPSLDRWLNTQPKPFAVAEIPVGLKARFHTTYMLHSTAHWQKTVQGYSGVQAPLHDELFEQLKYFPDERSLQNLARLGVTYVVIHKDMFDARQWADVEQRLPTFASQLVLVHEDQTGQIYAIRKSATD